MQIDYVVFDIATGTAERAGLCQPELLDAQAGGGQRALATSALTVGGNRTVLWEEVKTQREERLAAGVTTPFGLVQTDTVSRGYVTGLVTRALIALVNAEAGFSRSFTTAANTSITLDAAQIIAMGALVEEYVNAVHEHSQNLREQIDAAADMAELLAIDISVGWP